MALTATATMCPLDCRQPGQRRLDGLGVV